VASKLNCRMCDCMPQEYIQKCIKKHRYIAKSHEYPCPYCENEKLEKIIEEYVEEQCGCCDYMQSKS